MHTARRKEFPTAWVSSGRSRPGRQLLLFVRNMRRNGIPIVVVQKPNQSINLVVRQSNKPKSNGRRAIRSCANKKSTIKNKNNDALLIVDAAARRCRVGGRLGSSFFCNFALICLLLAYAYKAEIEQTHDSDLRKKCADADYPVVLKTPLLACPKALLKGRRKSG